MSIRKRGCWRWSWVYLVGIGVGEGEEGVRDVFFRGYNGEVGGIVEFKRGRR